MKLPMMPRQLPLQATGGNICSLLLKEFGSSLSPMKAPALDLEGRKGSEFVLGAGAGSSHQSKSGSRTVRSCPAVMSAAQPAGSSQTPGSLLTGIAAAFRPTAIDRCRCTIPGLRWSASRSRQERQLRTVRTCSRRWCCCRGSAAVAECRRRGTCTWQIEKATGNTVGPATGLPHWTVDVGSDLGVVESPVPGRRTAKRWLAFLPGFLRPGCDRDRAGCLVQGDGFDVARSRPRRCRWPGCGASGGRSGAVGVVDVPGAFLGHGIGPRRRSHCAAGPARRRASRRRRPGRRNRAGDTMRMATMTLMAPRSRSSADVLTAAQHDSLALHGKRAGDAGHRGERVGDGHGHLSAGGQVWRG